jgi:hypothetical protein
LREKQIPLPPARDRDDTRGTFSANCLAVGVCLLRAGEFWVGHYFFALGTVAVAVGCDQNEPLIEVEVAEYWMLEEMAPQIGLSAEGKILRAAACGFEFRQ